MTRITSVGLVLCLGMVSLTGCASIPGKTRDEQIQNTQQLVDQSLADLYKQHPDARAQIEASVGYSVMSNKITKIPVFGVGAGHGVAIRTATGEKTYLRMRRFDFGAGWGARALRSIVIFRDEKAFRDFIDGMVELKVGAEAAAKVGESGAAGGGAAHPPGKDRGYTSYLLTDAGVSATATAGVIRVKPVKLKK